VIGRGSAAEKRNSIRNSLKVRKKKPLIPEIGHESQNILGNRTIRVKEVSKTSQFRVISPCGEDSFTNKTG